MLKQVTAARYVEPLTSGGSVPAVVEADDLGMYVVKCLSASFTACRLVRSILPTHSPAQRILPRFSPGRTCVIRCRAYGRYRADNVSTGSQPDWYVGFLEGVHRLMPPWETYRWVGAAITGTPHTAAMSATAARHHATASFLDPAGTWKSCLKRLGTTQ